MKRYLILLIWIVGILLPLNWFSRLFPTLRTYLGPFVRPIISAEWVHVIAHTALFAGVVLLLAYAFKLRYSGPVVLFLLTMVLTLGLLQENLQLVVKQRAFGGPEVFDLLVDLSGGLLGIWIWGRLRQMKWLIIGIA